MNRTMPEKRPGPACTGTYLNLKDPNRILTVTSELGLLLSTFLDQPFFQFRQGFIAVRNLVLGFEISIEVLITTRLTWGERGSLADSPFPLCPFPHRFSLRTRIWDPSLHMSWRPVSLIEASYVRKSQGALWVSWRTKICRPSSRYNFPLSNVLG